MKDLFTVAIVGRPNVGKSSLFNALLGYRRAIVLDHPGTTLDEVAEKIAFGKDPIRLIDSQGIFSEKDRAILASALDKADAVLFVVDAMTGATPFDRWIATEVKSARKPTLLVANKNDAKHSISDVEFAELGFDESIGVSAAHQRNLEGIKEWCLEQQGGEEAEIVEEVEGEGEAAAEGAEPEDKILSLALVGRPNTGKSTLMNRLCDVKVSRVSPIPHTTRDPIAYEFDTPKGAVRIIDTAGMRRPRSKKDQLEVFSIQAATRTLRRADVVFLLLNANEPVSDQDMRLLSLLEREGKPAAVLLNFWDLLSPRERKHFMENTEFAPFLSRFRTLPISGLTGWNVEQSLPLAFRLFKGSRRRVKTSKLNRLVENILAHNPPPTAGKQNFNILYASQVKVDPPTFVFFMNRKGNLPTSYMRYIENRLRRDLGFEGQTLRVYFRGERDGR